MSLREELAQIVHDYVLPDRPGKPLGFDDFEYVDLLLPRIEKALRDAEAQAIEQCAQSLESLKEVKDHSVFRGLGGEELTTDGFRALRSSECQVLKGAATKLRSFSPDPDWLPKLLECERLEARLAALYLVLNSSDPNRIYRDIADLKRQLAEAGKEAKDENSAFRNP